MRKTGIALFLTVVVFYCLPAMASSSFSSGDMLDSGRWSVGVNGGSEQLKPVVTATNGGSIGVPSGAGSISVFGTSNADVTMDETASVYGVSVSYRPEERLQYRIDIDTVRDFELEFSSGAGTNRLRNQEDGVRLGFAVLGSLSVATPVTPAISWELWVQRTSVRLGEFAFDGGTAVSDVRADQLAYGGDVTVGWRFGPVQPFAGLDLQRCGTRLEDRTSGGRISGHAGFFSPLAGAEWFLSPKESLGVRASFVDDKQVIASAAVRF